MFFRVAVAASVAYLFFVSTRLAHDDCPAVASPPAQLLPPPAPAVVVVPATASATRVVDIRRADLEQTSDIARSARIVPALRHGAPAGVKVYAIRPGSLLEAIGLENGDTVRAINDVSILQPDAALSLYSARNQLDHFDIDLERKGERVRILVLVH
jgi:general secretion pathway protein C